MGTMPEKMALMDAIRESIKRVLDTHLKILATHLECKMFRIMEHGIDSLTSRERVEWLIGEECGPEEEMTLTEEELEDPAEIRIK